MSRRPPLGASKQALVTRHRPLALGIARRMWRTRRHLPHDDFVSSADLGLVQAAVTYEEDAERPFPPYASCRIVGSIRDWIGSESHAITLRRAAEESALAIAEQLHEDEGALEADEAFHAQSLSDRAMAIRGAFMAGVAAFAQRAVGEDQIIEREACRVALETVRCATTTLPERDRQLIERHYFGSEPLQTIAEAMGISYRTVRRMHGDALLRLGRRLSEAGVTDAPVGA